MMGYANANDKQVSVTYTVKVAAASNVNTANATAQNAANLAPAAGASDNAAPAAEAKPAKKATSAKKTKKKPAKKTTVKDDDAAFDDAADTYDNDPWEPLNRATFGFNHAVDTVLLRPVTVGYRFVVPQQGRTAVTHFLENLYSPVVFVNSLLQADPQNSFATLWRFILNTTFGFGGLHDFAGEEVGLHNRPADLGETFAFYGADAGPYFVIPLMGPSDVRDTLGRGGDLFFFPPNYADSWVWPLSIDAADAIDGRSRNMELIDNIYKSSLDPYATFRSAYQQKRAEDIRRGKASRDAAQAHATGAEATTH